MDNESILVEITGYSKNIDKLFNDKKKVKVSELIGALDDTLSKIEDLKDKIRKLEEPNDYDPEMEIPEIHGPGISW